MSSWFRNLWPGVGAVGISLARMGHDVFLTDREHLLPLIRYNAWRNGVGSGPETANGVVQKLGGGCASVAVLRWEHVMEDIVSLPTDLDLVIGGDLAYDGDYADALLRTMSAFIHRAVECPSPRPSPRVLLALADRDDELAPFLQQAGHSGWTYTSKWTSRPWDIASAISVYEFTLAAAPLPHCSPHGTSTPLPQAP